jgi:ribosome recycling factor
VNNIAVAAAIINTLFTTIMNALMAIRRYQELVAKAEKEGRDITDDELAALKADSHKMTDEILKRL